MQIKDGKRKMETYIILLCKEECKRIFILTVYPKEHMRGPFWAPYTYKHVIWTFVPLC